MKTDEEANPIFNDSAILVFDSFYSFKKFMTSERKKKKKKK